MTPDAYFENLDNGRKEILLKIRNIIFDLFPDIEENMDYRMPTYILDGQTLCALASQKNYMALYIMPYDFLGKFEESLKKYNCGASCIRFKKLEEKGFELFKSILDFSGKNYPQSIYYGRMNAQKK